MNKALLALLLFWFSAATAQTAGTLADNSNKPENDAGKEVLPELEDLLNQQLHQLPANTEISAASRVTRSSSDSMAVTHVINDKDIKQFNLRSLADILAQFVGITTREDSAFTYIGARGIGRPGDFNSRFLFMLDGTRINESLLDAGLVGHEFFVDVELIERVEYTPGASAALYGNNALLGVINIVTKTSSKLRGINTSVSVANNKAKHARITGGIRADSGSDSWLSLSQTKLDNIQYPLINIPPHLAKWQHLNEEKSTRLMLNHQNGGFKIQAAGSKRERQYPDLFAFDPNVRPLNAEVDNESYLLSVSFDDRISDDIELYLHASTHGNDFTRRLPVVLESGALLYEQRLNSGRWSNLDSRLIFLGLADHELMFGFDYQRDHRKKFMAQYIIPEPTELNFLADESRYGVYVQDLWRWSDKLQLQWALRYDDSDSSTPRWSPSYTLKYNWTPQHKLLLRHSRAFRVANFLEHFTNTSFDLPIPENESTHYNEASLVQNWSPSLSTFITAYQAKIENLISQAILTPIYVNTIPLKSQGLELGFDKRWANGVSLVASAAFQHSEFSGGIKVANSPEFIGQLRFSAPIGSPDILFSINSHVVSERRVLFQTLPSFASHDVSISWQPFNNMSLALGIRNITDKKITEILDDSLIPYVQQRRQAHLSINWSWGQ
ncbi:TonB-dependent receptor plug domain-containing protein [Pseudoalteromonas sp. T1lg23B]|uniref:TonB-dependent receptor plug domain-containing protein n=1 Tax=Pseudoalteromonas sp. T1lg23B TaxID=2077097 RepID=UPI000CF70FB9|nr:TonB-dependent receptor [Pseudoalteromonas sp. T1lg23B]